MWILFNTAPIFSDLTEKGSELINHSQIVELFVQAITRNNSARRKENQLPSWLEVPCHDEEWWMPNKSINTMYIHHFILDILKFA